MIQDLLGHSSVSVTECLFLKRWQGAACRAPAGSGGLCFFHANPDSARTLGQIGGRENRRSAGVNCGPGRRALWHSCAIPYTASFRRLISTLAWQNWKSKSQKRKAQLRRMVIDRVTHRRSPGAVAEPMHS